MLCLDDCFATTTMPQPTEITQLIFGQPLRSISLLTGTAGAVWGVVGIEGGVVVEDDMDRLVGGKLALESVEKADEFDMAVALACSGR